jgi:antitoxin MazE
MEIPIIPIGNSKGIRLSKTILKKYNLQDSVEVVMENEYIILKPVKQTRKNWEESFIDLHENKDDELLINDVFEDEKFEE